MRRGPRPDGEARHRRARRVAAALAAAMLAGGLPGGCGTGGAAGDGLRLRYERRAEPVGIAVWTVEPDGVIRYAGGRDALAGRDTWTGRLDPADEARLRDLVAALPAALDPAAPADEADEADEAGGEGVRTELIVRGPDGRRRLRAEGDPAELAPILELLREASAARLDRVLRRLPRPTEPVDPAAGGRGTSDGSSDRSGGPPGEERRR